MGAWMVICGSESERCDRITALRFRSGRVGFVVLLVREADVSSVFDAGALVLFMLFVFSIGRWICKHGYDTSLLVRRSLVVRPFCMLSRGCRAPLSCVRRFCWWCYGRVSGQFWLDAQNRFVNHRAPCRSLAVLVFRREFSFGHHRSFVGRPCSYVRNCDYVVVSFLGPAF